MPGYVILAVFFALLVAVGLAAVLVVNKFIVEDVAPELIIKDDKALREYLKTHTPAEAVAVIKAHPEVDCHQRVHKIGRTYYELNGNKAFTIMNSECQSGFTHGATEAFFREHGTANLAGSLATICNNDASAFFDHQCFHGIGHGLMAFNDYDLPESLRGCDLLPRGLESCYSGVFMENVVGAIGIDEAKRRGDNQYHVSSWLSKDPHYPCNAVEEKYRSTCYFFQSSRMFQLNMDAAAVAQTCDGVEQRYHLQCFASMGRDVGSRNPGLNANIERDCSFPKLTANQVYCIHGAAENIFWEPAEQTEAVELCTSLVRRDFKQQCYSSLASRSQELLGTYERISFCGSFEPSYRSIC